MINYIFIEIPDVYPVQLEIHLLYGKVHTSLCPRFYVSSQYFYAERTLPAPVENIPKNEQKSNIIVPSSSDSTYVMNTSETREKGVGRMQQVSYADTVRSNLKIKMTK